MLGYVSANTVYTNFLISIFMGFSLLFADNLDLQVLTI